MRRTRIVQIVGRNKLLYNLSAKLLQKLNSMCAEIGIDVRISPCHTDGNAGVNVLDLIANHTSIHRYLVFFASDRTIVADVFISDEPTSERSINEQYSNLDLRRDDQR